MGYGLPLATADALIAMGPDACNYFEHAAGLLPSHKSTACFICKKELDDKNNSTESGRS